MFGLGKKKSAPPAPPPAPPSAVAALSASDDQFVVMPEEYLPKAAAGPGGDKKIYWLAFGAAGFLLLLAGSLYFWLFLPTNQAVAPESQIQTPLAVSPAPAEPAVATTTAPSLKVIAGQAYDSAGQPVGSLRLTLPAAVADQYGEALGITVLSAGDLSLPANTAAVGGLYSLYPVGATLAEPVSAELAATALGTPESRVNYFPAALAGTVWQELKATAMPAGWSFSFDKFPAGPITIVERLATATAATATSPILGSSSPRPSADTDGDGLTDVEETLLGTNPALADTDSDTYSDRAEVFGGYSPLAPGEKLESADLFAAYTNPTYGYQAPYPKKWLADSLDQTNKQVLFISATEEFFEILVEENPLQQPIVDWYRSQSPALANVELDVTVLSGAGAVWSPDKLTLYVGRDGLIFILTYNKGTLEQLNWLTLFDYFYKNFKFGNTVSPA